MSLQWFKFYGGDYLSDPKILALSPGQRGCWITLLAMASMASTPGEISYLTEERLLAASGAALPENWKELKGTLSTFKSLGMVDLQADKVIVLNFVKRQERYLTQAEKKAKYRVNIKKKEEKGTLSPPNRIEEKRIEENRIREVGANAPTPAEDARNLFNNLEKQEAVIAWLVSKGIPDTIALQEVGKFVSYWTELNKTGTKQRWELEKTFEIKKRFATWFKNYKEFNNKSQGKGHLVL